MEPKPRMPISVLDPIGPAIEWVKVVLFRPFSLERWFVIGFCAWLAGMGSGGNGGGSKGGGGGTPGPAPKEALQEAWQHIVPHLVWVIPTAIFLVLLGIGIWIGILFVSSRGRFMFLHCVRHNVAEVAWPWGYYRHLAHSLFLFRIGLSAIGLISMLVVAGLSAPFLLSIDESHPASLILPLAIMVPLLLVISFTLLIVAKFTRDFIVPLMVLRQTTCRSAWKEFLGLLGVYKAPFFLYLLFQILMQLVISAIVFGLVMLTCCLACCVLVTPYLSTVLLLPLIVFKRSYSMLFLRQFGPAYDMWYQQPPAVAVESQTVEPPAEEPPGPEEMNEP